MELVDKNQPNGVRASQYKAKIDSVSPAESRNKVDEHEECFLGVSLENKMFERPKLDAIIEWVSRRFNTCTVLIGDSIHRLTLQSTHRASIEASTSIASKLGEQFIEEQRQVFKRFSDRTKFDFLTCGEVQKWANYNTYYNQLQDLFQKDPEFNDSVRGFSRRYHERRTNTTNHDPKENVALSCQYFLEEFAVFACLRQHGLPLMVYPGSFSTLKEIAAGQHPEVPAQLRELIVVSLHLKSRSKN